MAIFDRVKRALGVTVRPDARAERSSTYGVALQGTAELKANLLARNQEAIRSELKGAFACLIFHANGSRDQQLIALRDAVDNIVYPEGVVSAENFYAQLRGLADKALPLSRSVQGLHNDVHSFLEPLSKLSTVDTANNDSGCSALLTFVNSLNLPKLKAIKQARIIDPYVKASASARAQTAEAAVPQARAVVVRPPAASAYAGQSSDAVRQANQQQIREAFEAVIRNLTDLNVHKGTGSTLGDLYGAVQAVRHSNSNDVHAYHALIQKVGCCAKAVCASNSDCKNLAIKEDFRHLSELSKHLPDVQVKSDPDCNTLRASINVLVGAAGKAAPKGVGRLE
jgi:hypothetical protein